LVADFPKLCELLCLFYFSGSLLLSALDLQCSGPVNSLLHFESTSLLLLIETVGLVFSFGNLFVKNLLLGVLKCSQLFDLAIDHLLTNSKFFLKPGFLTILTLLVHHKLLLGKSLNPCFLCKFFLTNQFSLANLVSVSLSDISFDLSSLLLSLKLSHFLTLNILFCLSLDQLTFEHFFLQVFNVVDLEFFKLVRNSFRIVHLLDVFLFKFL